MKIIPTGYRILLVEDNAINAEVACEMLRRIGHTFKWVEDGFDAINEVKNNEFHLVLMDCQMPGINGFDATRIIRAWENTCDRKQRLPILAFTAHAMAGDKEKCLDCGMDDYISKPVEKAHLAEMIEKWL